MKKALFRKLAHLKKRKIIKKAIAGSFTAWALKHGKINQTTELFINSSQEIKSINKQGIHPINVGYNSAYISSDKVLIKYSKGRYLVEVGDTKVDILGFTQHTDRKSIKTFESLMNKMYNLDLQY